MTYRAAALFLAGGLFALAAVWVATFTGFDLPTDIKMWATLAFAALCAGCLLLGGVTIIGRDNDERSN